MSISKDYEYIIFARSIVGIGGAEIYVRNKVKFLQNLGINVTVISVLNGEIKINDFLKWKSNIVQECIFDPFYYSNTQRKSILRKLRGKLNIDSLNKKIIIESSFIQGALWSELLCNELKAQNFVFLLDDVFPILKHETADYLFYKLKRKELVGIHDRSLEWLFKENFEISQEERYNLHFTCINSIENIEDDIKFSFRDITIATISRLNKNCLHYIIDGIINFAHKNPEIRISYVLFGGGNKKIEKQLSKKFNKVNNIEFTITGEMFPIPYDCVKQFDLFISVAGAARATWYAGVPTLSMDINTGKPIGILGFDTQSTQYKDSNDVEIWNSIEESLEDLFINKKYNLSLIREQLKKKDIDVDFSEHLNFMENSLKISDSTPYKFEEYKVRTILKYIVSVLYFLFGGNGLILIMNSVKAIKNKILKR